MEIKESNYFGCGIAIGHGHDGCTGFCSFNDEELTNGEGYGDGYQAGISNGHGYEDEDGHAWGCFTGSGNLFHANDDGSDL